MQEIELSAKKKFLLKYEGQTYELRKPNLGEARQFEELAKDPKAGLSTVIDYMAKLGLPAEVTDTLEPDQLWELVEKLGAKKN